MKTGVVLFSGGVDSTYIVVRSINDFDRLILNTYRVPGMTRVSASKKSAEQLIRLYGDKVTHNIIDIRAFAYSVRGNFFQCLIDNLKYRFFYSWCMGCKIAMHLFTIDYCKKHNILYVLDGSNYYDVHALEQHKDVKDLLSEIYKSSGLDIITPSYYEKGIVVSESTPLSLLSHLSLYKKSTEDRAKYLRNMGIDLGRGFMSQYRGTQPSCVISVFFNAIRLPLKLAFKEEPGCCYLKHGYLNYVTDKVYAQDPKKRAMVPSSASATPKHNIYLDNASTTEPDPEVIKAVRLSQDTNIGNPSSVHRLGLKSEAAVEKARIIIAQKINAAPEEIYFTSSGTEANNLAIKGLAFANDRSRPHFVTSRIEHPSVLNVFNWLEKRGFEVTYLPVSAEGLIDPRDVERSLRPATVLVSVMHANNEMGTIEPIKEIGGICRKKNVFFHTDACQSFLKTPLDVKKQNLDLVTLNAHKIHGPRGAGALYIRQGIGIEPLLHGGGQENTLRSGTHNTDAIVGFGKASEIFYEDYLKKMTELRDLSIESILGSIPGTVLRGPSKNRLCNNININFSGVSGKMIASRLNDRGIYVSTGAACSSRVVTPSKVLMATGLSSDEAMQAVRISLSKWTTREELDILLESLVDIVGELRKTT